MWNVKGILSKKFPPLLTRLCANCSINPCNGSDGKFRNPQIPTIQIHRRRSLASSSIRIQPLRRSRYFRFRFQPLFHRNPLFQTKSTFLRIPIFMDIPFTNLIYQILSVSSEINHRRFNFLRFTSLLVRRFHRCEACI